MHRLLCIFLLPCCLFGQNDSIEDRLLINADFRFRIEQDWNSQRSDGTYRDDRSRARIRARLGLTYMAKHEKLGFRMRTGNPKKQQDPQITLGNSENELEGLPVSIERAFYAFEKGEWYFWLGKNDFSFYKNNELFWSDNVFPEGLFISYTKGKINLSAGHFIIQSSNQDFGLDAFLSAFQVGYAMNDRFKLNPGLYYFNKMAHIPDGNETFQLNYAIAHLNGFFQFKKAPLKLKFDVYRNLIDYTNNDQIQQAFAKEVNALAFGLAYKELESPKDWRLELTYTYLEQYANVNYFAQNDWARWDYSAFDSPDGRLSNLKGLELVGSYQLREKTSLTVKYYIVEDIIRNGPFQETGSRIRLDLDFKI
ncbi:MAG: putative porin [Bacteroidota bacterium]